MYFIDLMNFYKSLVHIYILCKFELSFDKFIIKHYKTYTMNAAFTTGRNFKKMDPVFGQLSFDDHEQIVFCNDKDTGLKLLVFIIR
jgi:hypothetical protein